MGTTVETTTTSAQVMVSTTGLRRFPSASTTFLSHHQSIKPPSCPQQPTYFLSLNFSLASFNTIASSTRHIFSSSFVISSSPPCISNSTQHPSLCLPPPPAEKVVSLFEKNLNNITPCNIHYNS